MSKSSGTASGRIANTHVRPSSFVEPIYHTRPVLPPLPEFQTRLASIWASKTLTNAGPQHIEFERKLSAYLQAPSLSLHSNATIALMAVMKAMGLAGDVITTPFTFAATPNAIVWAGLNPVFADIDETDLTLDADAVEAAITPATRAILAVHVLGSPCDVEGLARVAKRHGLKLIYDAAHAFGMKLGETPISSYGDASVFSLHATKLFHSAEGGAVAMNDAAAHARLVAMRNFGFQQSGDVEDIGLNSKMSELHAALGLVVLDVLEHERQRRQVIANIYVERLKRIPGLSTIVMDGAVTSSLQYFPLLVDPAEARISRDSLIHELSAFNVFARKYFFPLCSDFSAYRNLPSAAASNLPVASRIVQRCMCLPFYGGLSDDDAHRLCDMIEYIRLNASA